MIEYFPVGSIIHVVPDEPRVRKSGLVMADSTDPDTGEAKRYFNQMATVLAVGPGKFVTQSGKLEPVPTRGDGTPVRKGDRVLFQLMRQNFFNPHGSEVVMITFDQVVCVVRGEIDLAPIGSN